MNQHLGSNFDDFLAEEGILAETQAVALRRVAVVQPTHAQSAKVSTDRCHMSIQNLTSARDRLWENPLF
jgi:antitoxin HicB